MRTHRRPEESGENYVDRLIRRQLSQRGGIGQAYNDDAQVNLQIKILEHHASAFERACQLEGIDQEQIDRVLETFIYGAFPNQVQAHEVAELRVAFENHLSTNVCTGPESILHPGHPQNPIRRG